MSKGNSNPADLSFTCKNSRKTLKNKIKQASAKQIIEESRICDYLARYTADINHILQRAGEHIVVGLEFEEVNKHNDINLRKLDPIVADYVKSLIEKIRFANRKMLKSFRLKLSVEEVTA